MTFIPTSTLEWQRESLSIDTATAREGLEAMFKQRIRSLNQGAKCDMLVSWSIGGHGPLAGELRRGKLRGELLEWLRIEFGLASPAVWTVGIDLDPQDALPAPLYEQEEQIWGISSAACGNWNSMPRSRSALESLLTNAHAAELFAGAVAIANGAARTRVLREAALLGLELLGGEPAAS